MLSENVKTCTQIIGRFFMSWFIMRKLLPFVRKMIVIVSRMGLIFASSPVQVLKGLKMQLVIGK